MKSVMISIKPKWCELIASGQKTIEVRKTAPKEVPFRCYIYCTKGKPLWLTMNGNLLCDEAYNRILDDLPTLLNGKVIGEFICDKIIPISCYASDTNNRILLREQPYTCLTDKQMIDYLGNGVEGKGWHISDLVIYDNPKALREFKSVKGECQYSDVGYAVPNCDVCDECALTRAPQSWMYVWRATNE